MSGDMMPINELLLRYSAPCAKIKLKDNLMSREDYDLYMDALKGRAVFPAEKYKEIFKKPCKKIDPEKATKKEVREFFFGYHNEQAMDYCRVVECKMIKPAGKNVLVRRLDNNQEFETLLYLDKVPKKGSKVVFHIDGVVDKL